ncbi:MAG: ketoacyl-ACP synthase III [Acidobacteriota bacterium]
MSAPRHARIVATGRHLPTHRVSNDDLRRRFAHLGGDDEGRGVIDKFEASTGIRQRWWTSDDQATSDLALAAARQALERAGRRPEEVDLILLGTDSPDYITPATSVVLQHKLGATNAGTFDIACACASFPTGLITAAGWIATNPAIRTVLVVGVYLMHRLADPDDPMIFFYGDGAGAAVVEAGDEPGFVTGAAMADGAYHRHWGLYAGGTAEPASVEAIEAGRTQVRLLERYPPDVNHDGWPKLARRLADQGGFALDDIALWIFSQVRKPSIEVVMDDLGLPRARAHTIMEEWGYTGSACLAMALDDALIEGRVGEGDLVALIGSGVGYNQAGTVFRL